MSGDMYCEHCGQWNRCLCERSSSVDKTPIIEKEHLTVDDCLKLYEEEGILGLVDKVKAITLKVGIEKGRQMERERIIGMIKNLNSFGYPYGADFKSAILQALKGGKDV